MKIIWSAFIVHLIFLVSVFDIYFTTPIVHGISSHRNSFPAPAKRLVLFVADGMRADTFFRISANRSEAPFLRNIIEKLGTWGVSHTRVPTESRPGHVALIAGLYEDPSAIAKGWKENPVEFDSIFNRSVYTWAWGSPDILPMFSKAIGDHMWIETYAPEDQDFSGGQKGGPSWLDKWVFSRFESFVAYVMRKNNTNEEEVDGGHRWKHINDEGVVFFLHLLASDTAGHIFKPHSREYQENVFLVDGIVERAVKLMEKMYNNDGRTAYVFTSDHGMTDWGSHGAGDWSETLTPLVLWGAGIPEPVPSNSDQCKETNEWPPVEDGAWNLSHLCRRDVWQADITPLMATLLGLEIPVNSVGHLPLSYLNLNEKDMAEAAFTNARQMLAQHSKRRVILEQRQGDGRSLLSFFPSFYRPFPSFPPEEEELRVKIIRNLINQGQYKKAVSHSDELFELALAGLEYHHRYHQPLLLISISVAFIGWITILMISVLYPENPGKRSHEYIRGIRPITDLPFALVTGFIVLYLFVMYSPLQYYVYCLLPVGFWWLILRMLCSYNRSKMTTERKSNKWNITGILFSILHVAVYILGVEILVISFFHRWILSLGMLGLAFTPLVNLKSDDQNFYKENVSRIIFWALSCFMLGIFPMTQVVGKLVNTQLVMMAGSLFVVTGTLGAVLLAKINPKHDYPMHSFKRLPLAIWVQLLLLLPLTVWNISEADKSFIEKKGLPFLCQILSWALSVIAVCMPISRSPSQGQSSFYLIIQQFMNVCLSMAVPFLLLSVNHEGLFLLTLVLNAHAWILLESTYTFKDKDKRETFSKDDFRRAYIFMFLVITSFFGTGNVASVNSFDPAWVRRFISIFSPHTMGALILAKTCFPFIIVSCAFRAINLLIKVPTKQLFLVVLAFSDAAGLHFLHLVKDKGSWLDIGSSLSHFVILETMVLFLLLLYGLSCALIPSSIMMSSRPAISAKTSVKVIINPFEEGGTRRNDKTHHD